MAKCINCQEELPENCAFCPNCGARVEPVKEPVQPEPQAVSQPVQPEPEPQPAPQPAQPQYQQPTYQQPAYQQPVYQQPVYEQPIIRKKSVGLLVWSIIMIVISTCSCSIISLILSIIACAKVNGASKAITDEEEAKKRKSAKGLLIASVILLCIGFVVVCVLIPFLGAFFDNLAKQMDQFDSMYKLFRLF